MHPNYDAVHDESPQTFSPGASTFPSEFQLRPDLPQTKQRCKAAKILNLNSYGLILSRPFTLLLVLFSLFRQLRVVRLHEQGRENADHGNPLGNVQFVSEPNDGEENCKELSSRCYQRKVESAKTCQRLKNKYLPQRVTDSEEENVLDHFGVSGGVLERLGLLNDQHRNAGREHCKQIGEHHVFKRSHLVLFVHFVLSWSCEHVTEERKEDESKPHHRLCSLSS
mmetsp:Transcript_21220/g.42168  ORF Transcript_21220/g.42168 Transcript_21220/m.42168 type:complete len:224 (-) Transcript_21220:791-1462(-)